MINGWYFRTHYVIFQFLIFPFSVSQHSANLVNVIPNQIGLLWKKILIISLLHDWLCYSNITSAKRACLICRLSFTMPAWNIWSVFYVWIIWNMNYSFMETTLKNWTLLANHSNSPKIWMLIFFNVYFTIPQCIKNCPQKDKQHSSWSDCSKEQSD